MIRLSTYIAHSASQGYALRFPSIGEGNYRPAYYANGTNFVHGGKGTFQNYNQDQKAAIRALPETADGNDYYLFFVDCYDRLDTAGMVSNEIVSGYMPVGRHYGFIYNEFNNPRTIAHEVGHGVNALHHTFSAESETFHATERTDNLMDYNGGTALNHKQWQWSHEKHRNVLGFLDDEGEGEGKTTKKNYLTIDKKKVYDVEFANEYKKVYNYAIKNGGSTVGYEFETITIYLTNKDSDKTKNDDENINTYTLSSTTEDDKVIKNVFFGGDVKEIELSVDVIMYQAQSEKKEASYVWYKSGDNLLPIFKVNLVKVYPTVAYRINDEVKYKNEFGYDPSTQNNVDKKVTISQSTVSICPVYLTYSELDKQNEIDWEQVCNRSQKLQYLVSALKFADDSIEIDNIGKWNEYSLVGANAIYEICGDASFECEFSSSEAPQIAFLRKNKNEDNDYYIEENYITPTNNVSTVLYNKTCSKVNLYPTDRRYSNIPKSLEYSYTIETSTGDPIATNVKIGNEITIATQPSGSQLIVKDVFGIEKGRILFEQIAEAEELCPILNLAFISGSASSTSLQSFVDKANILYKAMNVKWQLGKVIELEIEDLSEHTPQKNRKRYSYVRSFLEKDKEKYSSKEYYIIVLPNELKTDYKDGDIPDGFIEGSSNLDDNVLYIYQDSQLDTPAHELGHCNGLNEFAIDYYGAIVDNYKNAVETKNSTNVMGYADFKHDFKKEQLTKIRNNIKIRIK